MAKKRLMAKKKTIRRKASPLLGRRLKARHASNIGKGMERAWQTVLRERGAWRFADAAKLKRRRG